VSEETRIEDQAVNAYLRLLEVPKRTGRRLTVEQLDERIKTATEPVARIELIQQRMDLLTIQANQEAEEAVTEAFVKYAPGFIARKNITYGAWREMGVPPEMLARIGYGRVKAEPTGEKRTRHQRTPEFYAEVYRVFQAAGAGPDAYQAVAQHFGYQPGYVPAVIAKAVDAHQVATGNA